MKYSQFFNIKKSVIGDTRAGYFSGPVEITCHVDKTCLPSLFCGLYTQRGQKTHLLIFMFMFKKLITLVTRSYPFYL